MQTHKHKNHNMRISPQLRQMMRKIIRRMMHSNEKMLRRISHMIAQNYNDNADALFVMKTITIALNFVMTELLRCSNYASPMKRCVVVWLRMIAHNGNDIADAPFYFKSTIIALYMQW